jgi:biopolymer transport protein ExbD
MSEISQSETVRKHHKVRGKKSSSRIDMTPMVDLAFLLLTFFMLTTTFTKPQTMEITIPEKPKDETNAPLVNERRVMTLILGEDDKIYWFIGISEPKVKRTDFSKNGIRPLLEQYKNQIKDLVVLIKPSEDSRYKNIVDILDEMNITSIARFALVEITPEDEELVNQSNL